MPLFLLSNSGYVTLLPFIYACNLLTELLGISLKVPSETGSFYYFGCLAHHTRSNDGKCKNTCACGISEWFVKGMNFSFYLA